MRSKDEDTKKQADKTIRVVLENVQHDTFIPRLCLTILNDNDDDALRPLAGSYFSWILQSASVDTCRTHASAIEQACARLLRDPRTTQTGAESFAVLITRYRRAGLGEEVQRLEALRQRGTAGRDRSGPRQEPEAEAEAPDVGQRGAAGEGGREARSGAVLTVTVCALPGPARLGVG